MHYLLRSIFTAAVLSVGAAAAFSQATTATPKPTPLPTPIATNKIDIKNLTAEQAADFAIAFYSGFGGTERLTQIRKTTLERGKVSVVMSDGNTQSANYQLFAIRGESGAKEKIRLDQEFPTARYSLILSDEKMFGVYNNTVFTPTEEATKRFENQIAHSIDTLLRYKENGSTLSLSQREKIMGVDYYVIDVTDKLGRKTRFYVSAKSFRVMMLTYEDAGVTYKRKFYDYNYAQGTLVPYRSVLWAGDKQVEETEIGTITYGQKIDEGLFSAS